MVRIFVALFVIGVALFFFFGREGGESRRSAGNGRSDAALRQGRVGGETENPASFAPLKTRTKVETTGERLARLFSQNGEATEHKLTSVEIEEYLSRHKTNAFTLVTAFSMSRDQKYLKMAAAQFPDDPLVQSQMLLHDRDLHPKDRQKWLEAFKESSPDNSFPNLLAAHAHLENGDLASAAAEIAAAKHKTFDDFFNQIGFAQEEAYASAGRSVAEAKALGMAEVLLPHLAKFKALGTGLAERAAEAGALGDGQGQTAYLEAAWQLGKQLRDSGSKGVLITDMVGLAIENIALNKWPQDTAAPFLNRSVAEQQLANKEYRAEIREVNPITMRWLPTASDSEIITYFDRMRMFGELNAMNWLRNQHPELIENYGN